ncbi:MAG: ATP-dependent Clp protease proteolytic subunit, partial [Planctomycetota bacterium]
MKLFRFQGREAAGPWRTVTLVAACLLVWTQALAQSTGTDAGDSGAAPAAPSVPAYRQADKVVVITLEGAIDSITALSIARRVALAEQGGADAIVLEVDSPGGEVGAVLEITDAIKGSSINNTVAWINTDAYSGGAIAALACREIVTNNPASMGDAFPVTLAPGGANQTPGTIRGLTPAERTKILPVLMADVTDSARRAGWDEYMVQAIIIDGIELWWVEDTRTGERLAINEDEFRMLFGREPVRGKPLLAGVTGGVSTVPPPLQPKPEEAAKEPAGGPGHGVTPLDFILPSRMMPDPDDFEPREPLTEEERAEYESEQSFRPASGSLEDVEREFASPERTDLRIERDSRRPVLSPDDAGFFKDLGYLCDGTSAIVMRDDQMRAFGFASRVIRDDDELKAYFGANELIRVDQSWSEGFVRFATGMVV